MHGDQVDHVGWIRADLLRFLRSPDARDMWTFLISETSMVMPASWTTGPLPQQTRRVLSAEIRRIAGGCLYTLEASLVAAVRDVAEDDSIPLPFSTDVLPAPSGMIVVPEDDPLTMAGRFPLVAVTWGPPLAGFGAGVHLSWWTHKPGMPPGAIPVLLDMDVHLPALPSIDVRLSTPASDLPTEYLSSARPLRSVVAAWMALTTISTTITEHRPSAPVNRLLVQQQAQHRGVLVASTPDRETARRSIIDHSVQVVPVADHAKAPARPRIAATPVRAADAMGVFGADLDDQLDPGGQRLARLYRHAASYLYLAEVEAQQRYPSVFTALEEFWRGTGAEWSPWCWLPLGHVATGLHTIFGAPRTQAGQDASRIAALGAWIGGGRHTILIDPSWPLDTAASPMPADLPGTMPAAGVGLIVDEDTTGGSGGGPIHLAIACLDDGPGIPAELVLLVKLEDQGNLADLGKITLFLREGDTVHDAVRFTAEHYDAMDIQRGEVPVKATESDTNEFAGWVAHYTGALRRIVSGAVTLQDAGGMVGRKLPAAWPPEPPQPGDLSDMTMWVSRPLGA